MKQDILEKIEVVLSKIRPTLHMDGGGIELVNYYEDSGVVEVKMQGACVGCPMSEITLKMGIEAALKEVIPEIKEVIAINPHEVE